MLVTLLAAEVCVDRMTDGVDLNESRNGVWKAYFARSCADLF